MASKVGGHPLSPLWLWCTLALVCPVGTLPVPHLSDRAACVLLKSKKNVIVADTPSAVFHYSETNSDETASSRKTEAIFRAAKKDLLTLMKLDVSGHPPALSLAWVSMETCAVSGGTAGCRWVMTPAHCPSKYLLLWGSVLQVGASTPPA